MTVRGELDTAAQEHRETLERLRSELAEQTMLCDRALAGKAALEQRMSELAPQAAALGSARTRLQDLSSRYEKVLLEKQELRRQLNDLQVCLRTMRPQNLRRTMRACMDERRCGSSSML